MSALPGVSDPAARTGTGGTAPPTPLPIRMIPIRKLRHRRDNHNRESQHDDLMPSLVEHGQKIPGLVAPVEGEADCWEVLDGNRRLAALVALGIPDFLAMVLPRPVGLAEAIEVRLTTNVLRKGMSLKQIAEDAAEYMKLTGATQKEAARKLGLSEATLSRAFNLKLLHPDDLCELEQAAVPYSSIAVIAPLSPREKQRKAIAFATARNEAGELPPRSALEFFIKREINGEKTRGRRPGSVSLKINGRTITLTLGEKDTAAAAAEDLKQLALRLAKLEGIDCQAWGYHFA